MAKAIPGLHHITAISGPPQPNVDFFTGVLDQRLVKRTVNFDAPDTYHLYYGNHDGAPGTILTFFPFIHAGRGTPGSGSASSYAYAIPEGGYEGWLDRLSEKGVVVETGERFGARLISLSDPDGAPLDLVETDRASGESLDGFHSVTLWVDDIAPTARLLTDIFGYGEVGSESGDGQERLRLRADTAERAHIVDVLRVDGARPARQGAGSIHHVAFRAETDAVQLDWRERLMEAGHAVTDVRDRQYFNAIYFREPGGILFEIATDPPGFAADEPKETMGEKLMLPPQYERLRREIESVLPPLEVA